MKYEYVFILLAGFIIGFMFHSLVHLNDATGAEPPPIVIDEQDGESCNHD